jgi:hypothetical protein
LRKPQFFTELLGFPWAVNLLDQGGGANQMALIKCKDCGKDVSESAPTCPSCGAPIALASVAAATKAKKEANSKMGCGCLAVIALVFVVASLLPKSAPTDQDDQIMGCIKAQRFAGERLKAPSTADFQSCSSAFAAKSGADEWTASGYVDAQNGFGAKIRSTYIVKMRHVTGSDDWSPIDVSID